MGVEDTMDFQSLVDWCDHNGAKLKVNFVGKIIVEVNNSYIELYPCNRPLSAKLMINVLDKVKAI